MEAYGRIYNHEELPRGKLFTRNRVIFGGMVVLAMIIIILVVTNPFKSDETKQQNATLREGSDKFTPADLHCDLLTSTFKSSGTKPEPTLSYEENVDLDKCRSKCNSDRTVNGTDYECNYFMHSSENIEVGGVIIKANTCILVTQCEQPPTPIPGIKTYKKTR